MEKSDIVSSFHRVSRGKRKLTEFSQDKTGKLN